jgi:hypothetical protein
MHGRVITVPNHILEVKKIETDYLTVDHVFFCSYILSQKVPYGAKMTKRQSKTES